MRFCSTLLVRCGGRRLTPLLITALLIASWACAGANGALAANVAWLSFHSGDSTPSAPIVAINPALMAPDVGYTQLLTGAGHTVTRFMIGGDAQNVAGLADTLNGFDLTIISRSINSGFFDTTGESAFFAGLTKPMIIHSGYILRNNRLGFTAGNTIPDSNSAFKLIAELPAHPIFAGVALDGANLMVENFTSGPPMFNGAVQRGISVNTDPLAGGGTLIGRVGTTDPANSGTGMIIAEWSAGAILPSVAGNHTLAGQRVVFLTGGRETDGVTGDSAGVFDLTPTGAQMYLNTVSYLTGTPGDVNGDGVVDMADFTPIRDNFQKSVASREQGDLNSDGIVDFRDFRAWKSAFPTPGEVAGVTIPEPASVAMFGFAMVGLAAARRRVRPNGLAA